jgi:DNA-binding XRE family transcriptional regulator
LSIFEPDYKTKHVETGQILRQVRGNLALSKTEISKKMGITDKTYRKYENEGVPFEKFLELIKRLDIKVSIERKVSLTFNENVLPMIITEEIN